MRAPPMRQPTAAPVIAPVLNCGPGIGVEVAPDGGLEDFDDAVCEGVEIGEVPEELVLKSNESGSLGRELDLRNRCSRTQLESCRAYGRGNGFCRSGYC